MPLNAPRDEALHLLVDTLGLVLVAMVTAANLPERDGARLVFAAIRQRFPRLLWIWVDGGYGGAEFCLWVMQTYHWILRVVRRPNESKGFQDLRKDTKYKWWHCSIAWVGWVTSIAQSNSLIAAAS